MGECRCAALLSRFLSGDEAALHAERAIALGAELGAGPWEAFARMSLGQRLLRTEGRHAEGEVHIRRAVELCREHGHTLAEAANLNNLAEALINLGRPGEAEQHLARSIQLHRAGGNSQGEALALANRSSLRWQVGRTEEAAVDVEAALELLGGPRNRNYASLLVTKARVLRELGREPEALVIIDRAANLARDAENRLAEGMARCLGARWRADAGDPFVFQELEAGLKAVAAADREDFLGRAFLEEVAVLRTRGRRDEAWSALDRADRLLTRAGDSLGRADVLLARAELLLDRADRGGAARALDQAADLLETAALAEDAPAGRRLQELRSRRPGGRRARMGGYQPIDSLAPM